MAKTAWGATPEEWSRFDLILGLGDELLPVVSNPNALVSRTSKLKTLGKVPSIYNSEGDVVGLSKWPQKHSTLAEIKHWSKETDYGICLQTRTVRALDIDISDPSLVATVKEFIFSNLSKLPLRFREDSAKCLLAFSLPGDMPKRVLHTQEGMIEFLATGQQFIAAGTHPKGARYKWTWQPDHFPEVSLDAFEALWQGLISHFAVEGTSHGGKLRSLGPSRDIEDDRLPFLENHECFSGEYGSDGQLFISCPFKSEHTGDSGISETAYFPAGTNGHPQGHYKCLHAHCQGKTDSDFDDALGSHADDFSVLEGGALPAVESKTKTTRQFSIIDASEYLKRPRPGWIIYNFLPRAEVAAIYGASTAGKTFVALDMAFAIARGIEWLGKKVEQGRVIYVAAEGAGGMRDRLEAYAVHHQISLDGIPLQMVPDAPNFLDKEESLTLTRLVTDNGGKADVIFVDTLAQVTVGGNENSAEDMSKAIANCKGIHKATGALVVLVHHAGKDLDRGLRGWSGLKGALDANIEVSREGENRSIKIEKLKEGADGDCWGFSLEDVELFPDARYDETPTSKIVVFSGKTPNKEKAKTKQKPSGAWQGRVLAAFEKLGTLSEDVKGVPLKGIVALVTQDHLASGAPISGVPSYRKSTLDAVSNLVLKNRVSAHEEGGEKLISLL